MRNEEQGHIQIMQRQKMINDRREELERTAVDRENEEKWKNEQLVKQQMLIAHKKLEIEREEREKRRVETEREEIRRRLLAKRMDDIAKTPLGRSIVEKLEHEDFGKIDVETIMLRQQEELAKEAKEHLQRMKAQEKRLDHLERAKRIEEIPILEKSVRERKELEQQEWEIHENERITNLIEERKIAVQNRDRMKRMKEDKELYLKQLLESRKDIFVAKLADFEKRLTEEKARRLAERKSQRIEERRRKYMEEQEELERQRQEEIQRREDERLREEKEKADKEREEQNRITLEKQLARSRELEEKEKENKDKQPPRTDIWRPSRRREENTSEIKAGDNVSTRY